MTAEAMQRARARNEALAAGALRVLGLALRNLPDGFEDADMTRALTFVGFVGMIDPLRDEVRATIAQCCGAGIRVVMITGDQQATAAEIGRQLGLDTDAQGQLLQAVHGSNLADLDDAGWIKVAGETSVFARVSPEHKLRIVEALQHSGQVVATTGDGVNDAPALRQADIGIGIRGTEVAKEASSMVITDDNFATIVSAIEQGRVILPNGRSIVLERMPGADEAGFAGLEDGVDFHRGRLFLAAGLSTLLNLGLELGRDSESDIARAIREGGQGTFGRAGDDIVRRQPSVPPPLTVRPGSPVRVIVNRDPVLEPYGG